MLDSPYAPLAALNATAFALCVLFLAYVVSVIPAFLRTRPAALGERDDVEWHIFVPCLNEERVIVDTVEHLLEIMPTAHVWCIDDASDDSTPSLLAWLARRYPQVHLVTRSAPQARQGKGPALNAAWNALNRFLPNGIDRNRVIVGVVDADGRLDPFCPDVITGPDLFGDPQVGAVQIQVRVTQDPDALVAVNPDRLAEPQPDEEGRWLLPVRRARVGREAMLTYLQDLEFSGPIAAMQFFRERAGSVALGGNGQFTRLSALDTADGGPGPWRGALLEDFELGLHVLLGGYRSRYCHDTFVAQTGLTRVRPLIRQRTRWAQGNMQCLRYLWEVLNSRRIPLSGALEIGYYMYIPFSQLLGSVVFPLSVIVHLTYAWSDPDGPSHWLLAGGWALIPLSIVFGVVPHAVWGLFYRSRCARLISVRRSIAMAFVNVGYGYLLQIAAWTAFIRVLRGRNDWTKTKRAGEHDPPRRPAPALRPAGMLRESVR